MTVLRRGKLLILMMLVIIFMLTNNNIIYAINLNGRILNNVYVQDINLSDLTKEEATKKINSYIEQNNEFELLYNNEFILVNKETLGVDYKVDELVDRAYSIGRDKDLITDMKTKISLKKGEKKIIPLTCSYNIKKVDNLIDKIYSKLYISPKDASAKIVFLKCPVRGKPIAPLRFTHHIFIKEKILSALRRLISFVF